jgi:outer membrane protein OmpA-like peptidoglycan-associated protein
LTWRSLHWRVEALQTGKAYREIVLLRSQLYQVQEVFLIHRETGLLLVQHGAEFKISKDADLVAPMLTVIQDFVKDSFEGRAVDSLDSVEAGEFVIWIQNSPQAILAGIIRGAPPRVLKGVFQSVLDRICSDRADALARFDGNVAPFDVCKEDLAHCFLGQGVRAKRRPGRFWWQLAVCVVAVILAFWGFFSWRQAHRWHNSLNALRREPGIVITGWIKHGGRYRVMGLRDPLARNPVIVLQQSGLSVRNVDFDLQSYMSMQQPFAAVREYNESRQHVENRRIYFRLDSAEIFPEQLGFVQDVAQDINKLLSAAGQLGKKIRIVVEGHADRGGTDDRNKQLSIERAHEVATALNAAGVPAQALSTQSSSTSGSPNDRTSYPNAAFERLVSFSIRPIE